MTGDLGAVAAAYARFWENLAEADLGRLDAVLAPDVRFRDPFNDVRGLDRVRAVFAKMFRLLQDVRIEVTDCAVSSDKPVCYMRWVFSYRLRRWPRAWRLEGVTEVHFDERGMVAAHLDHWDAASQVYEKMPAVGFLLRRLRRRLEG